MLPSTLECSLDAAHQFAPDKLATICPHDGAPLLVRYPPFVLDRARVAERPWTMWRYREALPVDDTAVPISLGEGATPLLAAPRTAARLRIDVPLYAKDESQNPTASFKARGMSVAVTRAVALGAQSLV
ncbi:MAG: pyridoxal-phosphate dependent enzyme, partial [Vulcanimicrobiaceae bacterium]